MDDRPARTAPSILHVDLDAFFAAVEQRDKPSLLGRPVVVGGLGPRGVVATASYEARVFGVQSAMPTAQARARCPHAAYLFPRFGAYRETSDLVMALLLAISPAVEPLSLDEAYVDLATGPAAAAGSSDVAAVAQQVRRDIAARTGVTASVGAARLKVLAKLASDDAKPDGLRVVAPAEELAFLHPQPVRRLPGVGPVTADRLHRLGVRTVADLAAMAEDEVVAVLGQTHGRSLHRLAHGVDERRVEPERPTKSVSVEDTFATDITERRVLDAMVARMAEVVAGRLVDGRMSARTVSVKVRLPDFSTHSRASTLAGPTDDARVVTRVARSLLGELATPDGVRLLGVGVSGLSDWVQDDLFAQEGAAPAAEPEPSPVAAERGWRPGADVLHAAIGRGWVWGSGRRLVTVRFETRDTPPGPVHTFAVDDPALTPADPLPLGG